MLRHEAEVSGVASSEPVLAQQPVSPASVPLRVLAVLALLPQTTLTTVPVAVSVLPGVTLEATTPAVRLSHSVT
jgi:hypothetical protein